MTGAQLRNVRRRLRLTQAALAAQLAATPPSVARSERGEVPIREPVARLILLTAKTMLRSKPKRAGANHGMR